MSTKFDGKILIYNQVIKLLGLEIQQKHDVLEYLEIGESDLIMTEIEEMVELSEEQELLLKLLGEEEISVFIGDNAEVERNN